MSDKKNFSALGRIDGKYVEEADAYFAVPEKKKDRGWAAGTGGGKKRRRGSLAGRLTGIAVGAAIVCAACYFGTVSVLDGRKDGAGLASSVANDLSPENVSSREEENSGISDSDGMSGDCADGAASDETRPNGSSDDSCFESSGNPRIP